MESYLPIADYGAIGNLHTIALVGKNGAIDWCCLPDMDSPSIFGRILDSRKGGTFWVRPTKQTGSARSYVGDTNVLRTYFDTPGGRLVITDFMPLSGSIHPDASFEAPPELHRILHAEHGDVEVKVTWCPRFDYAREAPKIQPTEHGAIARSTKNKLTLSGLPERSYPQADEWGPFIETTFTLRAGDRLALVVRWDADPAPAPTTVSLEQLDETLEAWHDWVQHGTAEADRSWASSAYEPLIIRSELVLKLLSYAPTGAIAAAGTTSLPETIGGVRNWDYRYSWIRDAALAAQALHAVGHDREAQTFIEWAEYSAERKGETEWGLHIMYDFRGEPDLPEEELTHLEGYRESRPARIGNEAADQLQLDIYGELLGAAYEIVRLGDSLDEEIAAFLTHVASEACRKWTEPDEGIWEVRDGPHHFTYSKVRAWSALDRASRLVKVGEMQGDVEAWQNTQVEITKEVLEKGYDEAYGAFTRSYGSKSLDASNLLIPLVEFLPFDDYRIQNTIDATIDQLTCNNLVYRYKVDDGLPGEEGAFGLCTFWLVDALALSERLDEAYEIYDTMAGHANDLNLLSEQVDPHTGELLGNFPQGFTHIGLINSMLYLAHMEGRELPIPPPIGSKKHRMNNGE